MEMKFEPFRSVAKEINRYLGDDKPDNELTAALLTVTSADAILSANGGSPALVAWVDDEGRHALAAVGPHLIRATVGGKRPEGFLGYRKPDGVTVYRRSDVRSIHVGALTAPDFIGNDVGWHARSWTIHLDNAVIGFTDERMKPHSEDRVTAFVLSLAPAV